MRCGEADEGWYVLSGLAALPDRFPAAWDWLTGAAMHDHGQPADDLRVKRRAMSASSDRCSSQDSVARADVSKALLRLKAGVTKVCK